MSGPLIYVGRHGIKHGELDRVKKASGELAEFLEANHPREVLFQIAIDEDNDEMLVVQVHPDEESLLHHVDVAGDRIKSAYEFLESTISIDIHGDPSDQVLELLDRMAMGASLRIHPAEAGFSRL
jgi:hypothetical protein